MIVSKALLLLSWIGLIAVCAFLWLGRTSYWHAFLFAGGFYLLNDLALKTPRLRTCPFLFIFLTWGMFLSFAREDWSAGVILLAQAGSFLLMLALIFLSARIDLHRWRSAAPDAHSPNDA